MTEKASTGGLGGGVPRRRFLRALAASAVGGMVPIVLSHAGCAPREEHLPVGAMEAAPLDSTHQLFVDDYLVAGSRGVRRVMHRAERHPGNPVLSPDPAHPWEDHRAMFPCLRYDAEEKVYKLWYWAMALDNLETRIAYATSPDLVHWDKPALGIVSYKGSTDNNLVYDQVGDMPPIVLKEPREADPQQLYKMIVGYCVKDTARPWVSAVALSPDGVHWSSTTPTREESLNCHAWSALRDPALNRYVAYSRHNNTPRTVGRQESDDLVHWSEQVEILAPDEGDPDAPRNATEFYGLSVYKEGGLYIGFLWVFHTPFPSPPSQNSGQIDVQLVASRDGVSWQRLGNREPFLGLGEPGDWDDEMVWMGNFPVVTAERVYFCYSGWDHEHYGPREVKPTAIGLATVRRDGYVSLRADGDGEVITRPVIPGGSTVHINADARDGEIRVGMLDEQGDPIRGYGIEACAPLTGDVLDGEVTWGRDPEEGTRTGKPRALQISMRAADLYSLWVD